MEILKPLFILFMTATLFRSSFAQSSGIVALDTASFGKNEQAGRYVKTRGFNMYYETYGKGEPLLFIHGGAGSINDFINQVSYFARRYKVILADSRAQGKSVDVSDSLSYEMMTDDLNALLDTLQLDSCYVIGWSDGADNGLLLAIRHPEKVKKLAVTGANLWPDSTAVDSFFYHWVINYYDTLKKMEQTPKVKTDLKLVHLWRHEPQIALVQLNKIKCPALVIAGDHDLTTTKHTLLIAEAIPQSYLWILPNSGHATLVNYKDQFNEVVNNFFTKPYREIVGWGRGD
jgi:pimeloyl-ACP methyl ester carboxylesterase